MNYLKSTFAAGLVLAVSSAFAQSPPTATVSQSGIGNQSYVCLLYTSPSPRDS